MTLQLCPAPGFAKRSPAYAAVIEQCANDRPDPSLNRLKVDKALALGTGDTLTPQERCLMMALLSHLDIGGTAAGETCVWPGAARLCQLLGIGESTLRRLKGSLEEKGFLLRRYDRRNRPLSKGAIDLSPFLLKVPELLAAIGHTEVDIRTAKESLHRERADHRPSVSAHPPEDERPIERNRPRDTSERSSDGKLDMAGRDQHAQLAETLKPGITANSDRCAAAMFGERRGARLWTWAVRRHGPSAALGLAIAAAHPKVKDPAAWFGWFATTSAEVDLEGLAEAALAGRPRPITAAGDPLLERLIEAFARVTSREAALSYLAKAQVRGEGATLLVLPAGRTARHRLSSRFAAPLGTAAQALGYRAVRIGSAADFPSAPHEGAGRPDKKLGEGPAGKGRGA